MLCAAPAFAEDAPDKDDKGELPAVPCTPPKDLKRDMQPPWEAACKFFSAVAERDPVKVYKVLKAPFYFENKQVNALEDAGRKWAALLNDLGKGQSTLYSVEVLTYDDMVKKYGKPPAKLDSVPLRGAMMAVANVDGHAQVAALKRDGGSWMVFAFHD